MSDDMQSVDTRRMVRPKIAGMTRYSLVQRSCRFRMNANELCFPMPAELHALVMEALREVELHRYPDPEACELRKALARTYQVDVERILVGNGSDEFLYLALAAYAEPSASVLIPVPAFGVYSMASMIMGHEAVEVPLTSDWQLDGDRMLDALRRHLPPVTYLSSPNNPTGNLFDAAVMRTIITHSPGMVVLDEAYIDYAQRTYRAWLDEYPNVLVLKTMSKVGLAGARLGVLLGRPEAICQLNKVRPPYNVNSMTQAVVRVVLEHYDLVQPLVTMVIDERRSLYAWLRQQPNLTAYPSDANFILFRVPGDATELHRKLMDREVLVRSYPGHAALGDCLRVTIGQPHENAAFRESLAAIMQRGTGS